MPPGFGISSPGRSAEPSIGWLLGRNDVSGLLNEMMGVWVFLKKVLELVRIFLCFMVLICVEELYMVIVVRHPERGFGPGEGGIKMGINKQTNVGTISKLKATLHLLPPGSVSDSLVHVQNVG